MADLRKRPYAKWLEEALQNIAEEDPEKMAIVFRCRDGAVGTKYFGCDVEDQATFAHYLHIDAVMATVLANADHIRRRADEMEAEEDDQN